VPSPANGIRRQHLLDYIDHCLAAKHPTYINNDLRLFHGLLPADAGLRDPARAAAPAESQGA
jgi:hypothetical protein